jgi:type III pantothenate kinase
MILALDVGNSQIYGGVFEGDALRFQFRKSSKQANSSDELGMFLRSVVRENGMDPAGIHQVALSSVVPAMVHSLKGACAKYFDAKPFILQAGVRTGLKIRYRNPLEVGSDRIATAIAATHLFPGRDLIVADFGTATTYSVITADRDYLGGMIMPGLRISMEALELQTAKLPAVEIVAPEELIGRSTVENIQSGLYYGALCALQGVVERIRRDVFSGREVTVIGTGGFARLFERERVFDAHVPELILTGLNLALKMNA